MIPRYINQNTGLPFVSIIVPAYNAEKTITQLLESIMDQSYPKSLFDIIIVDNNSKDQTRKIIKKYPVKLLEEKEIHSSYAARNKGIREAKGQIIAFIDSDCIATKRWLEEGVKKIIQEDVDIVGGKVKFYFSKKITAAELYDSITNMQIESNIKERGVAKTANLFVKLSVFEEIGLFPPDFISGGDVYWTAKANKNGFKINYSDKAIVKHPARTLKGLLKKQFRVGIGIKKVWIAEGNSKNKNFIFLLKFYLPARLSSIKKRLQKKQEISKVKLLNIWFVSYLCNIFTGIGFWFSIFNKLKISKYNHVGN